jgi:membrane-bound ClpP family serine protease
MENSNPVQPNPDNSAAGRGLGTAGMVLGIIAIVISFIPCIGWGGIVLAIVGVILSAISLSQAGKAHAPKGMALAGLICSILAIVIGFLWVFVIAKVASHAADAAKMIQDPAMMDSMTREMEDKLKMITDTLNTH